MTDLPHPTPDELKEITKSLVDSLKSYGDTVVSLGCSFFGIVVGEENSTIHVFRIRDRRSLRITLEQVIRSTHSAATRAGDHEVTRASLILLETLNMHWPAEQPSQDNHPPIPPIM